MAFPRLDVPCRMVGLATNVFEKIVPSKRYGLDSLQLADFRGVFRFGNFSSQFLSKSALAFQQKEFTIDHQSTVVTTKSHCSQTPPSTLSANSPIQRSSPPLHSRSSMRLGDHHGRQFANASRRSIIPSSLVVVSKEGGEVSGEDGEW